MALKSTIYKATLHVADMDRQVYGEHGLTLALHPSETEERLMVRLLAYALNAPADAGADGALQMARGLSDADEPDLWRKTLAGEVAQWIELGQPDERRLARACGKADAVVVYAFQSSTAVWWQSLAGKVTRLRNLQVWQLPHGKTQALAALCTRSMQMQVQVQDRQLYCTVGDVSLEIEPVPLWLGAPA